MLRCQFPYQTAISHRPASKWLSLARIAALLMFCLSGTTIRAQDVKPLIWAADEDGGVPYVFTDATGKRIGFEVDIAEALSRQLGRPIVFKQYPFDSLITGLKQRADFDFAMNGLEITPENVRHVRFTRPYYLYQQQLVVKQGETRFRTIDKAIDLQVRIGTLGGSAAYRLLRARGLEPHSYDDQNGPYQDLALGRLDGVVMDLPIALYYAAPNEKLKHAVSHPGLEFAGPPFADGFYGIAVKKDNEKLASELDKALKQMLDSGELKKILTKWELWNDYQEQLHKDWAAPEASGEMGFEIYFPMLLKGAAVTVVITLASMLLAIVIGLPVALSRMYGPAPLRWLATTYIEFFRGIPVLLLLYFLYYGLAGVAPQLALSPWSAAILGFGLNYAAYEAEIYRAGISAVPIGQWEAAASLGMSPALTFRRVILPQAFRHILPPMTNDLVALFKDTSVVSIIAVVELSKQYQILSKSGAGYVKIGLVTAGLYLIMSVPLGYYSRYLEKKWHGT